MNKKSTLKTLTKVEQRVVRGGNRKGVQTLDPPKTPTNPTTPPTTPPAEDPSIWEQIVDFFS